MGSKQSGYLKRYPGKERFAVRRPVVLIVDDDASVRESLKMLLKGCYETFCARDGVEAMELVRSKPIDIVLMDLVLPSMDGITTLEKIREIDSSVGVIMLSANDSAQRAVEALKKGAYDYITKPFDSEDLMTTFKRYTESLTLKSEVAFLKSELRKEFVYGEIVSKSPGMKRIFELIEMVSRSSSSVLITGESGTGKELVAAAIQSMGDRRDKPLVAVNCGAVPSELMESELFGHEKGSFTGAHARKIGKFEYADGGTIFFDEVSTLPMSLQIKLLRVLQEKTFERVGGNIPVKVDVRVIAATNVDLRDMVRKGTFREDLYYRLNVVPIELPPLRERVEDIPLLVRHFIEKHSRKCNKIIRGITPDAVDALTRYRWPGNVRELENLIERLVVLAKDGGLIAYADIPAGLTRTEAPPMTPDEAGDFHEALKSFERNYIIGVLNRTNWNRIEAARVMNIHRNTLLMKMKSLGIKSPRRSFS